MASTQAQQALLLRSLRYLNPSLQLATRGNLRSSLLAIPAANFYLCRHADLAPMAPAEFFLPLQRMLAIALDHFFAAAAALSRSVNQAAVSIHNNAQEFPPHAIANISDLL